MSTFDYSKWDNIELSDDESDCHPNIDKESWFRMKHRTRVEREEREEMEKNELDKANTQDLKRVIKLKELLRAIESGQEVDEAEDPVAISNEISALDSAIDKRNLRLKEIEKQKKWNWENMCHVVEERTIVTSEKDGDQKDKMLHSELPAKLKAAIASKPEPMKAVPGPATVKEEITSYAQFVERYDALLEKFSEIRDLEMTEDFLLKEGSVLFAEHSQNYLLLSCLEDEMNNKSKRAELVARQSQILSNITELAVGLKRPPQDVVKPFFRRLREKAHGEAFESAVSDFVMRVRERAKVKRKEMAMEAAQEEGETEYVELSKEERLGPGGLDPLEVYESLPKNMQDAFDSKNVESLKAALAELTVDERAYHMKRCQDSGLWVAGGNDDDED